MPTSRFDAPDIEGMFTLLFYLVSSVPFLTDSGHAIRKAFIACQISVGWMKGSILMSGKTHIFYNSPIFKAIRATKSVVIRLLILYFSFATAAED